MPLTFYPAETYHQEIFGKNPIIAAAIIDLSKLPAVMNL